MNRFHLFTNFIPLTCAFSLMSCAAPSPKQQAFPALNLQVEKQVKAGGIVVYPTLTHTVKPSYPSLPAKGSVWAVMKVGPDGRVQEVKTVGKSPRLYQQAIEQALMQWRFKPGSIDQKLTTFPMQVKITFAATDTPAALSAAHANEGISFSPNTWIVKSVFPKLYSELETYLKTGSHRLMPPHGRKITRPIYPDVPGEGEVIAAFIVNTAGQAQDVHIIGEAPTRFQENIRKAMSEWEFIPATIDGKPRAYPGSIKFTFRRNS